MGGKFKVNVDMVTVDAVENPSAGEITMYASAVDGRLHMRNSDGLDRQLGGFDSPMAAPGDLIVGGEDGSPTRLEKGDGGQVLTAMADGIGWRYPAIPFSHEFSKDDWGELPSGRYGIGFSYDMLPFYGATALFVQVHDNAGNLVVVDVSISPGGDLVIVTDVPFFGKLLAAAAGEGSFFHGFFVGDWVETADGRRSMTFLAANMPFSRVTDLFVQAYDAAGNFVVVDASIAENGDLTIFSDFPFPGKILVAMAFHGNVAGMANPMEQKGDIIVGDVGGRPVRLGIGDDGQVLTAMDDDIRWQDPPIYTLPIATTTTLGGIRPDGTTITVDATTGVATAVGGGGMTNPMTAKGDVIVGGTAGAPARLGVGGDGQVLTATDGVIGWEDPTSYTLPVATAITLGGIKVGERLTMANGTLSADDQSYSLPTASATTLGGIKVGGRLTMANGTLSADDQSYSLPVASASTLGGIKVGTRLAMADGVLSATDQSYALPIASATTIGGIKPDGTTITVNSSTGVASSVGGGMANPMTAKGDLIVGGNSGIPSRLGKGTAGQVLRMNSSGDGAEWKSSISLVDPTNVNKTIRLDPADATIAALAVQLREEDVCENGVLKKRYVLASAPHTT